MKKSTLTLSVVALTAVLSSCGLVDKLKPPAPNPTPAPTLAPSVGNKIDPWDARTASADLLLVKFSDGTRSSLASTPIGAAGDFLLTLPNDAGIAPYIDDLRQSVTSGTCTGNFAYSDPAARGRFFSTLYVKENTAYTGYLATGTYSGDLSTQSVLFNGQAYLYTDRDTAVTGNVACADTISGTPSTKTYTMNLNLKKGWNGATVDAKFSQANNQGTYTYTLTSSGIDNARKWFFVADTGSLSGSSAAAVRAQAAFTLPNLPEPLQRFLSQLLRNMFRN